MRITMQNLTELLDASDDAVAALNDAGKDAESLRLRTAINAIDPGEDNLPLIDIYIPTEIIFAAKLVENFFRLKNMKKWKLCGIQERIG